MRFTKTLAIRAGVVLSIVVGMAALVMSGVPVITKTFASTSTSTSQTINLTVNEVITLTLSSSSLSLPPLTPGTPVTATSSATVTTNSASGWNLQVNRVNGAATLSSSTYNFPDATAWNGSNATTTPGSNLSFREVQAGTTAGDYLSGWGTDGSPQYAGFPTSAVTYASTSTYVGTAQTIVMGLRADAPATQVATNYSGSILVTAIALP